MEDTIKRWMQQIEARDATLFQQTEIVSQQLLLVVISPEGHQLFPKITNGTFWSRVLLGRTKSRLKKKKEEGYSDNNTKKSYDPMKMLEELLLPTMIQIFGGTYKVNMLIPIKLAQIVVAGKAVVNTADEFRTSVTCCHCRQRLQKKKHLSSGLG
ncbi:hypothetical protein BDF21DRAFT_452414 [Thamnidium elegans]|nr:hypothetical protein BDF21DRAFT_452414 [Thamnidium elegans]